MEYLKYALAAGLGAAVVIRSRVFSTRIGDREVAIGPGFIVDQLLLILDRQIDRQRALVRTRLVKAKMANVDFQRVAAYVSTMILGSRQSMSLQDEEDLGKQLNLIRALPTGNTEKAFALGFLILDFMGEVFLDEVVDRIDELELGGMKAAAPRQEPATVDRTKLVRSRLTGVKFADACAQLKKTVEAAGSPVSPEQKERLDQAIQKIAKKTNDQLKSYDLGFAVIDNVGADFLNQVFPAGPGGAARPDPPANG